MTDFDKPHMEPKGFFGYLPLSPSDLVDRKTPTDKVFSLAHFGVPIIEASDWQLEISGLVNQPRTLTLTDIKDLPRREINTVHQCAGSPLDPTSPKRRITNVTWAGVDLAYLLNELGIDPKAKYIWSYAPDFGEFGGYSQSYYLKDLSVNRILEGGVLLAYELNGEPLPHRHGFPVRLVIPGYYGTNSVKWICRMILAAERADSVFTTKLYTNPARSEEGKNTTGSPVWEIAPESVIVSPGDNSLVQQDSCLIWGWAWSASGAERVQISVDDGKTWDRADLETRSEWAWQKFTYNWQPSSKGAFTIIARASDPSGNIQPITGARNAVHSVQVNVE